ncbi:hypothetical protein RFI_01662 [Reticulomyxa filosa]|uniref:Uncharacterized protein n=1 Tax=Reticulomyxa filosa TaxID=46433 RepID=X6PB69_RETFI|nr:hypothetical protein RFI_01662 [Reticulomyxa filosa]|eukprot:ETO35401.1 hypothetical protein RFI_01662 [Reticulomyxa filosa]
MNNRDDWCVMFWRFCPVSGKEQLEQERFDKAIGKLMEDSPQRKWIEQTLSPNGELLACACFDDEESEGIPELQLYRDEKRFVFQVRDIYLSFFSFFLYACMLCDCLFLNTRTCSCSYSYSYIPLDENKSDELEAAYGHDIQRVISRQIVRLDFEPVVRGLAFTKDSSKVFVAMMSTRKRFEEEQNKENDEDEDDDEEEYLDGVEEQIKRPDKPCTLAIVDVATKNTMSCGPINALMRDKEYVNVLALSPEGFYLAIGTNYGRLMVCQVQMLLDATTVKKTGARNTITGHIVDTRVWVSNDTNDSDALTKFLHTDDYRATGEMSITSIAWSVNEDWITTGHGNGDIYLWKQNKLSDQVPFILFFFLSLYSNQINKHKYIYVCIYIYVYIFMYIYLCLLIMYIHIHAIDVDTQTAEWMKDTPMQQKARNMFTCRWQLEGHHTEAVTGLCLNDSLMASSSDDGTIMIHDLHTTFIDQTRLCETGFLDDVDHSHVRRSQSNQVPQSSLSIAKDSLHDLSKCSPVTLARMDRPHKHRMVTSIALSNHYQDNLMMIPTSGLFLVSSGADHRVASLNFKRIDLHLFMFFFKVWSSNVDKFPIVWVYIYSFHKSNYKQTLVMFVQMLENFLQTSYSTALFLRTDKLVFFFLKPKCVQKALYSLFTQKYFTLFLLFYYFFQFEFMAFDRQNEITFEEAQRVMEGLMIEGVRNDEFFRTRDILVIEERLQRLREDLRRIYGFVVDDKTFQLFFLLKPTKKHVRKIARQETEQMTDKLLEKASIAVNERMKKQGQDTTGDTENGSDMKEGTEGGESTTKTPREGEGKDIYQHLRNNNKTKGEMMLTSIPTPTPTPGLNEYEDTQDTSIEDIQRYSRLRKKRNKDSRAKQLLRSSSLQSRKKQSDKDNAVPGTSVECTPFGNGDNPLPQQRLVDASGAVLLLGFASSAKRSSAPGSSGHLVDSRDCHGMKKNDEEDNIPFGETLMGDWSTTHRSTITSPLCHSQSHEHSSSNTGHRNTISTISHSQQYQKAGPKDHHQMEEKISMARSQSEPLYCPDPPQTYFIILTKKVVNSVDNLPSLPSASILEPSHADLDPSPSSLSTNHSSQHHTSDDEQNHELNPDSLQVTPDGIVLMGFAQP